MVSSIQVSFAIRVPRRVLSQKGDRMLDREDWLPLARKLDWEFSYTTEQEVFPQVISGHPWLPHSSWQDWEEAFKTSYREYVQNQHEKDMPGYARRDALGPLEIAHS